jgi:NTP pyrophosphatase (non-canonical NTP hydrolase)
MSHRRGDEAAELQLTLLDLSVDGTAPVRTPRRGLRVGELARWASHVGRKLERSVRHEGGGESFLLTQTVKLGEEVGELCAEILGAARLQRQSKGDRYSTESLRGELADVTICVAIIADLVGADLEEALVEKMALIDERMRETRRSVG